VTPARLSQPHRPPPPLFHEDTDDEEDPADDPMRPPSLPGIHGGGMPVAPGMEPAPAESGKPSVRLGATRHGLKLRQSPGESAEITGSVRAGELVMIMKDLGEWVLIMHSGEDDVSMGWTKRSEIAVR
jgi:hypothetical protein